MTWQADNAVVTATYSYAEAQGAVTGLLESGYPATKISVAARCRCNGGEISACYSFAGDLEGWGEKGRFWAGVWRVLSGWGGFVLPDFGVVLVAGPIARWIVGALGNAGMISGFSAVGAALYGIGLPRGLVPEIEATFEDYAFLVIASGRAEEVNQARSTLEAKEPVRAA